MDGETIAPQGGDFQFSDFGLLLIHQTTVELVPGQITYKATMQVLTATWEK